MTRARKNTKLKVINRQAPGDYLVKLELSPALKKKRSELAKTPWWLRAIHCRIDDGEMQTLLTSLLDTEKYPAKELIRMYEDLARYILPERRTDRRCPRVVKIKMSNFPGKLPSTTAQEL